jgi:hypothetical protein
MNMFGQMLTGAGVFVATLPVMPPMYTMAPTAVKWIVASVGIAMIVVGLIIWLTHRKKR